MKKNNEITRSRDLIKKHMRDKNCIKTDEEFQKVSWTGGRK
jgi:hypothetical protein